MKIVSILGLLSIFISIFFVSGINLSAEDENSSTNNSIVQNKSDVLIVDFFPVGTILSSLLPENKFQENYTSGDSKPEWVLMKGQLQEDNSDWEIWNLTGKNFLPDTRGKFLRGYNSGISEDKKGSANPDDTKLGDYQSDKVGRHKHLTLRSGSSGTGKMSRSDDYVNNYDHSGHSYNHRNMDSNFTMGVIAQEANVYATNSGGPRTAVETRPKNITVNFFVKVMHCASNKCK